MVANVLRVTLQERPYSIFQSVYGYREKNLCSSKVSSYVRTVHKVNDMYYF
jgi:hypothetical protein